MKPFAARSMRRPQRSLSKQARPQIGRWMRHFRASCRCRRPFPGARTSGDSIMTAVVLAPFPGEAGSLHRPRPLARAGMRARRSPADGANEVRREGGRGGRYADGLPLPAPRRRDRDLRRPSHGHVLCNSGIESPRDKAQESGLREEDVPEFLSEAGGPSAARLGGRHSRRHRPGAPSARRSCLPNDHGYLENPCRTPGTRHRL